ncbi:4-hydroxybenzoate octaprenyltransferase [Methylobacillus arboreus]|uniref:4-hydroxybenzoate octaprenyltransferase n=1 Tax=Methylobacillus arboreus TaxID=755170 RepID=UPI001E440727|nr:4-hydroxybenzoate octaprenyltransferase [Methylobacillus arboreus]MCB5191043.1 4-hydroxybenzoate octaprenyltransferase [Methylobacillus arboreus]
MNPTLILQKLRAYSRLTRLDKPIGILLLLWPTLWGLWLASPGWPGSLVLFVFIAGTVLMRSAGCVMNDLADRNFDGHVERTRQRPLVTGEVSVKEALLLAGVLSLVAFVLVLQLNALVVALSFPALFLAASYPLTKRFLSIPQAYLGIAFGFGIPMAFAAITGQLPFEAWVMLLANVFWAVAYDTEYAMVDRNDDLKIGIRSSAIFFGRLDILAVMICYAVFLLLMAWVGMRLQQAWPYFTGLVIAASIAVYHYSLIRGRDRKACFKAFLHNNWLGAVIFAGVIASEYL